jgi:hypothetical protein
VKLSNIFISILTATTIAAGVTAYQINNTNEEHKKGFLALSELNLQLVEELKSLKIDLSIYQQELQNSKAISASLNEKLLGLQRTSDLPEEMPVKITQQKQVEPEQSFEKEKEPEMDALLAFAKRIKNGESIANIEDNFREQFYEEEVDGNWAYEYETNIRDLAAADENNNFNIQELNCKTSACEIKITANENNAIILGTLFSKTLGEQDWRDKSASVIFNHKVKDGVMSILIGRDGNSFN